MLQGVTLTRRRGGAEGRRRRERNGGQPKTRRRQRRKGGWRRASDFAARTAPSGVSVESCSGARGAAKADEFPGGCQPPFEPCLQGAADGCPGGLWRHDRANSVRFKRYGRALPDASTDYRVASGQHLDEGGVIPARFRRARPRGRLAGNAGGHLHHYEGLGARQVIANRNTVRRRNRNPSRLHQALL